MKTIIASAAITVLATGSAYAGHTVSFMSMGGQYSLPPGYTAYRDHTNHVTLLRYSQPVPTNNQPPGRTVSFMSMGGQYSLPPG